MKDLLKVPTWRLEQKSNPRPFGRKASILPMCHHTSQCSYVTRTPRHHHISPVLKSLHWPRAHPLQVLSLTYNFRQSFQPTCLRKLFTIHQIRSTQSSSCLTLSRPAPDLGVGEAGGCLRRHISTF